MSWLSANEIEYQETGKFYRAIYGVRAGKIGEAVFYLSWGGVILRFDDGVTITFGLGDVVEVDSKGVGNEM